MNPRPNRELRLDDYDGSLIPNRIDPDPSPELVLRMKRQLGRLELGVSELGAPTGRYNCHGLVFASRRTNIDSPGLPVDIYELLLRDRYRRIPGTPQPGDVAIYRYSDGRIEHSGLVLRLQAVGAEHVPFIWSKWGGLGEYEHHWHAKPYHEHSVEYWRLEQ